MIRRHLAALPILAAEPLAAQELEPFTFATNWVAQGEHGGFYQAVADGTYEACGLDVTIMPGGPQVNGRALMLAGRADAYMGGNTIEAFDAVKEEIPIVVVAAVFQKEPQVIMTHPGRAESFEDLKDLTLFISGAGYATFYQWMVDEFGFTPEQRKVYTFNSAPFIADPNSGQQGYVTSEPFAIEREAGWKPDVFLLADEGFDTYSTTIEVLKETVESRPEAVRCFVDGTALGWVTFLYGDNAAAIERIKEDNPDMTDEQIRYTIDSLKAYGIVDSGDAETMGIGAMTDARMKSFYDEMVAAGVSPAGIDVTEAYTLDFVNKGVGLERKAELLGQ